MAVSRPPLVVLAGVAGSGKSTVGPLLAARLGVAFADADELHPVENVLRMARGEALDDAAREPWLTAVHQRLKGAASSGLVMACSALKQTYRDGLAAGLPQLVFVHLQLDRPTLAARLRQRTGHFFPLTLLDSQLAALEPLVGGVSLFAAGVPEQVAAAIAERLVHRP